MKITEQILLDGQTNISNGLHVISIVNDELIWWSYRVGLDTDGYNVSTHDRTRATEITLENDRAGTIPLDEDCATHPAVKRIYTVIQKIIGDEIMVV